jgi:hypothetical protein
MTLSLNQVISLLVTLGSGEPVADNQSFLLAYHELRRPRQSRPYSLRLNHILLSSKALSAGGKA